MAFTPTNVLGIDQGEMLQAAIILKNKFMFDYVSFKRMMVQQTQQSEQAVTMHMITKLTNLLKMLTSPMP